MRHIHVLTSLTLVVGILTHSPADLSGLTYSGAPSWAPQLPLNDNAAGRYHQLVSLMTGTQEAGSLCIEGVNTEGIGMHVCFAPGTPPDYVERISRELFGHFGPAYDAGGRWSTTSFGSTGSRGNPIRLRWSFVPDGTSTPGLSGQARVGSDLFTQMNAKFSNNTALWQSRFEECFTRWGQLAGLRYERVSDDGAAFPSTGGSSVGARGDVRIAGRLLDGVSGVLAFNFFPNGGDMVLDTADNWGNPNNNHRFLRNTVMHEHGHGIGLGHVDPTNGTKLMEPFLNTNFDGPQDDDIRGGQRLYGDAYEVNGTAATSTLVELGSLSALSVQNASLDRTGDIDFYRVNVGARRRVNVTVTPIGGTYNVGPSGGATPSINTTAIQNLQLEIYNSTGTTLLASATANGVGASETIAGFVPPPAGGQFLVRIFSGTGSADDVQRYTLSFSTAGLPLGDLTGDGCVNDRDLLQLLFDFGTNRSRSDIDGNGVVDDADALTILFNFGLGC
jgi:hypothetical protein